MVQIWKHGAEASLPGNEGEESVRKTGRSESKKGVTLGTVLRSEHWEVKCRGSM